MLAGSTPSSRSARLICSRKVRTQSSSSCLEVSRLTRARRPTCSLPLPPHALASSSSFSSLPHLRRLQGKRATSAPSGTCSPRRLRARGGPSGCTVRPLLSLSSSAAPLRSLPCSMLSHEGARALTPRWPADSFQDADHLYLAMDFMAGGGASSSLQRYLDRHLSSF